MKTRALSLKLRGTGLSVATANGPVFAMLDPPGVEDAHGDTMDAGALRLPSPGANGAAEVPLYFLHSYHEGVVPEAEPVDRIAIGRALVWEENGVPYFTPFFFGNTELSDETKRRLDAEEISACSVGYLTEQATLNGKGPTGMGEDVHQARLIEVSLVDKGAKEGAVRIKMLTDEQVKKLVETLVAVRADVERIKTKSFGVEMMCNSPALYFATEMMEHLAEAVAACQTFLMQENPEPALAALAQGSSAMLGETLGRLSAWLSSGAARGEKAAPVVKPEDTTPPPDAVTKWLHSLTGQPRKSPPLFIRRAPTATFGDSYMEPLNPPTPAALPPEVEAAIIPIILKALETHGAAIVTKSVEAALASRPNPPAPSPITGRDMEIDMPKSERLYAALGYRAKSTYLDRADQMGAGKRSEFNGLRKHLARVKASGVFNSIFEQGGALFARETVSTDTSLIEVLRSESVLLRAGVMTITDYGSRLTIGKLGSGVTVYWLDEGEPITKSDVRTALISLGAQKLGALAPISNDLMRLGTMDANALVGRDITAAIAVEVDRVGIKGSGAKQPLGFRAQLAANTAVATLNVAAISGTATADKIADCKKVIQLVDEGNLPGTIGETNAPFYLMPKSTMYGLSNIRDAAGWVFPGLQDLKAPTLNGFPVFSPTSVTGDARIDFVLAKFIMLGEAAPLELTLGENGTDFAADMMSLRAVTHVDWLVRRAEAISSRTGVTY
jgi:HK97 family phage major capsid protein